MTEQKKYKRKRDILLRLMVNENERDMIHTRMEQADIKSLQAYLLKLALEGHIIRVELDSVREMVRLLSNATNNINQIARRANETDNIYAADLDELRLRYGELWGQAREIMLKLSKL